MIPVEVRLLCWYWDRRVRDWRISFKRKQWDHGWGMSGRIGPLIGILTVKRWWRKA
jgi:hypothetical protein